VPSAIGFELTTFMRQIERVDPSKGTVERLSLASVAEVDEPYAECPITPHHPVILPAGEATPAGADLHSTLRCEFDL
jgi:hypothetical protein